MGKRLQLLPSHLLSRSAFWSVSLFAHLMPVLLDDVQTKICILKSCCQKVYGVARFPSLVLESEKRKLGTIFVAIGRFFENQHILNLAGSRRTHDPFNLRFRHAGRHLVIIAYS